MKTINVNGRSSQVGNNMKVVRSLAVANSILGFVSFALVVLGVIFVMMFVGVPEVPPIIITLVGVFSILSDVLIFVWIAIGIAQCPLAFKVKNQGIVSPSAVAVTMGIFSGVGFIFWLVTLLVANSVLAVILLLLCLGTGIFNSIYSKSLKK